MRSNWYKKSLVFGIIVLFIGMSITPSTGNIVEHVPFNNQILDSVDKDTDIDDISIDNSDAIEALDEHEEIITFIKGMAEINWIDRRGYIRGEVNLTWDDYWPGFINLSGFRRSESGIEYYNELVVVGFVYVYRFIGFSIDSSFPEFAPGVLGIAFGNIEWS